jgi:hypothetical protein
MVHYTKGSVRPTPWAGAAPTTKACCGTSAVLATSPNTAAKPATKARNIPAAAFLG